MAIKDWPGGVISKTPVTPSGGYPNSTASGVWTLDQAAYWIKQQQWPGTAPSDPYYEYVSLLLTGNGTNGAQNNTFLDSSTNNFTITRNGNTTQGTFSPYGNLWSNYFDGNGDYLNIAQNAAFGFGTGDFSLEFWAFIVDYTRNNTILDTRTGGAGLVIGMFPNGAVNVYAAGDRTTASGLYPSNQWVHIAVTRSGTTLRTFINGVMQGYFTSISTDFGSSNVIRIGYQTDNANYCYGYISNLRIIKGSIPASYQTSATSTGTSVFTPSTTPLTAVSGTSLLTCQSNRFIDNSSNNFTLTVNGNTSVQRFSPFNPTAPYSASTIGGSGYFDGSGDTLDLASGLLGQLDNADFTIETWVYLTAYTTQPQSRILLSSTNSPNIDIPQNGAVTFYNGTVVETSAGVVKLNTWTHIAVVRSGTTITIYVNGINTTSGTAAKTTGAGTFQIGTYINGYMSNMRITQSAVYTGNFTPPTSPVAAIANTKLLCNFTNAGIPDAAMLNDLETVGNAQVSTSVKKYGTGSMYFNGTDGNLVAPYNPIYAFGTGDFTVEGWFYFTDTGTTQRGLVALGDGANGSGPVYNSWSLQYRGTEGSNQLAFYRFDGTEYSYLTSGATISANTWTHIAVSRGSGTLKIFVNGVAYYSAANTLNFSAVNTNPLRVALQYYGPQSGYGGPRYWPGYIDDLRITKGYARYTANFTPPTAAFLTF